MAKPRRLTLLQLAIAASLTVVPTLLAVLLMVDSVRRDDTVKPASNSDRHVSVRQVAALKTFEYAIVRRDRIRSGPPAADTLLDRLPQCRSEWDGQGGALTRLRGLLSHASDRRLSPAGQMALQLAEIDEALLLFSSGENRRVTDPVGFDSLRWFDAVAAVLRTPVETPDYPGQPFAVQCSDVAGAVARLARSNGRMLSALAWRGTEVERAMVRWRPDQFVEVSARELARANPWAGIPGCIYFANASEDAGEDAATYYVGGVHGLDDRLCRRPEMRGVAASTGQRPPALRLAGEPTAGMAPDDERWKVPPSLGTMLQPLETLHRPTGLLYRSYTAANDEVVPVRTSHSYGPNRIDLGGTPVDVGFSIDLTIDPALQALAQKTAACYTGRDDICRAVGIERKEDASQAIGHRLLEHAMVRMAAIAIIDVASGRIEALAGALSPCTRQEYDGPGRSKECDPRMPYPIRYRPDALLNAAVFHDAMPASTIKPIMAAAFLSDPAVGARWLAKEQIEMARSSSALPSADSLRGELMRSASARFLDRMFCADKAFVGCQRPRAIAAEAVAFGWNGGCAQPREDCGKRDLLFGRGIEALGEDGIAGQLVLEVPYGRLFTEPVGGGLGAPFRIRHETPLDPAKVRQCALGADGRSPSKDDWAKCGGGVVVDVVAEGWGQGHARASALGGAGMMATLAAAANGQSRVHEPHLVQALHGTGTTDQAELQSVAMRPSQVAGEPNRISREAAEVILSGLSFTPRAGTARLACEQLFDARQCRDMDWIAGKTGTPTFPNDDRSLDDLAQLCAPGVAKSRRDRAACGPLRPYKWYVAAYRTDPGDPRWTKAIGVLTERNWLADTGRIHGAGDHGPNPAAEIAMQIAARQAGLLEWSTK